MDFSRKNNFFKGWFWFKFNNFRLVLGMTLKIFSCVRKRLQLKVLKEASRKPFCTLPPILNRAKDNLTDSLSVKTIKKKKYSFHWFIDCSVEVTCIVTVIILENMFGKINRGGGCAVELVASWCRGYYYCTTSFN